jgi:hypothetical protein
MLFATFAIFATLLNSRYKYSYLSQTTILDGFPNRITATKFAVTPTIVFIQLGFMLVQVFIINKNAIIHKCGYRHHHSPKEKSTVYTCKYE